MVHTVDNVLHSNSFLPSWRAVVAGSSADVWCAAKKKPGKCVRLCMCAGGCEPSTSSERISNIALNDWRTVFIFKQVGKKQTTRVKHSKKKGNVMRQANANANAHSTLTYIETHTGAVRHCNCLATEAAVACNDSLVLRGVSLMKSQTGSRCRCRRRRRRFAYSLKKGG